MPELVMMGATATGAIVKVSASEPVPALLLAVSVATVVPALVGVPLMAPLSALNVKPAGRPVAVKRLGLPVAAIK
jgi:hypothetical protein